MALTRAQLLMGDGSQGNVLTNQAQGVRPGGNGITIRTDGVIEINSQTIIGVMKLGQTAGSAAAAFNGYTWPSTAGDNGKQLQTDGTGVLSWADADGIDWTQKGQLIVGTGVDTDILLNAASTNGFILKTNSTTASGLEWTTSIGLPVSYSQFATPAAPVDGQLWFDCSTGSFKVYQSCIAPTGWFDVSKSGLPILPVNVSSLPLFTGGNGSLATPFLCSLTTVTVGGATFIINDITITGLAPNQFVPIVDMAAVVNGGRYKFTNNYANGLGVLNFQTIFSDIPASSPPTSYTANIKVGYGTAYIDATVNVVPTLAVSVGAISGTPTIGTAVAYSPGVVSGGLPPYALTYKWYADGVLIPGATSPVYIPTSVQHGKVLSVVETVTDTIGGLATATTVASAPVQFAPFPSSVWNPLPPNGLQSTPGGISGTYFGSSTSITTGGCIEASVNAGPFIGGTQSIANGDTLAVRWVTSPPCSGAPTGTEITGTITDNIFLNTYSLTLNRVPNPQILDISDTGVSLGGVTTKVISAPIAGLNTTAYVTYDPGSSGTNISASKDNVSFFPLSTTGTGFPVSNGDLLYIRQTVGLALNTIYTATIRVGDGSNAPGTYDEFNYNAKTVPTSIFPNSIFAPSTAPSAFPSFTNLSGPGLYGAATTTWADGPTNLTSTGSLDFSVNGGPFNQGPTSVANGDTVAISWDSINVGTASTGAILSGSLTNGIYTNNYTYTVSKTPNAYSWGSITPAGFNAVEVSNVETITGINSPAELVLSPGATLTNVQAQINGGPWTNIPTTSPGLTINPSDAAGTTATTVQIRGTTAIGLMTAYSATTTIGFGTSQISSTFTATTPPADPPGSAVYNSSSAFTVPTGHFVVFVSLIGGGGGGISGNNSGSFGPPGNGFSSGGGGGQYYGVAETVFPGNSIPVTVGGGGSQAFGFGTAGTGGTSVFANYAASGGGGGEGRNNTQGGSPPGGSGGSPGGAGGSGGPRPAGGGAIPGGAGGSGVLSGAGAGGVSQGAGSPGQDGRVYISW